MNSLQGRPPTGNVVPPSLCSDGKELEKGTSPRRLRSSIVAMELRFFLVLSISVCRGAVAFQLGGHPSLRFSSSAGDRQNSVKFQAENCGFEIETSSLDLSSSTERRRDFLSSLASTLSSAFVLFPGVARAEEEASDGDFASLAARATRISKQVDVEATSAVMKSPRGSNGVSAYDFSLPMEGTAVPFRELIGQEFSADEGAKVKAIVVVNIKQDDPVARRTIPELIALATKYGRGSTGSLAIVACPTDQGYYEPDTSVLIRLKLASEYGYGINPSTIITDKVNLLGTGSHPFWRWLQGNCRTPSGLGRIEGNFEKFLIDGRTGQPLRRYPRKYHPLNMADDIEAVIAGRPLPPARANWQEEWRSAAVEAERDTYRFEKGLNYFDQ
jgi:glutathione peroxidase-family protein